MSPILNRISILAGLILLIHYEGTSAIECFHCNSEYDPRCGDPFDEYSLGKVNCSKQESLEHLPDLKPTICRKTTQKVYGKVRVVRGCGYVLGDKDDAECVKRSGTHDVQAIYCSCTGDLCNGAHTTLMIGNKNYLQTALPLALTIGVTLITSSRFYHRFNCL